MWKWLILLLLFCIPIVYSARPAVTIAVNLSWNGGSSYTDEIIKSYSCLGDDKFRTYGGSTELWGRSWDVDDFNESNFRSRMVFKDSVSGTERPYMDHMQVIVYYELPAPNPQFIDNTPDNNSNIGGTLRVNVSSTENMTACYLEHNLTGILSNYSMILENAYNCRYEDMLYIPNETRFNYRVHAEGINRNNLTVDRWVNVSNIIPSISLNTPLNLTATSNTSIMLNWSVSDANNDLMSYDILISKDSDRMEAVLQRKIVHNGSYNYNFNFSLLDYPNPFAVYHLDNNSAYGENDTHFYDFANGLYNGTQMARSDPMDRYSLFGGGIENNIQQGTQTHRIRLGNETSFINLCDNGCSFSAWVNMSSVSATTTAFLSRYNATGSRKFLYFGNVPNQYVVRFYIDENGDGSNQCTIDSNWVTFSWNHWLVVYNNVTNNLSLYRNGSLSKTEECGFNGVNVSEWHLPQEMIIGRLSQATSNSFVQPYDEIAIFNYSLNASDVASIYNLSGGTYYWVGTIDDSVNTSSSTEEWQFTIEFGEICDSSGCIVDCSANPTFNTNQNMLGNNMVFDGNGYTEITSNYTNVGNISITNGCLLGLIKGSIYG